MGGRHGHRRGHGSDHGGGMSVVVMDDGSRDGVHSLQEWAADASDPGEDLRRRDREGG